MGRKQFCQVKGNQDIRKGKVEMRDTDSFQNFLSLVQAASLWVTKLIQFWEYLISQRIEQVDIVVANQLQDTGTVLDSMRYSQAPMV